MNLFFRVGSLLIFCFGNFLNANEPIRTWTSSDGRTLEASFIEKVEGNIKIRTSQGSEFTLPITRFSKADQEMCWKPLHGPCFKCPNPLRIEERVRSYRLRKEGNGDSCPPLQRFTGGETCRSRCDYWRTPATWFNHYNGSKFGSGSIAHHGITCEDRTQFKTRIECVLAENFRASAKKVTDLKQETSSSRVAFKLETGDLVVDVKKLNRESSFIIESPLAVAGIRGLSLDCLQIPILPNWLCLREVLDSWMRIKKPRVWKLLKKSLVHQTGQAK